jgi:hypothetical protein
MYFWQWIIGVVGVMSCALAVIAACTGYWPEAGMLVIMPALIGIICLGIFIAEVVDRLRHKQPLLP